MSRQRSGRRGRWWTFILALVSAGGLTLIGAVLWRYLAGSDGAMAQQLATLKPYFLVWRIGLGIALIAAWRPLIERFLGHWPTDKREALLKARWRVAAWLVALELVIVQGVVADALGLLVKSVFGNGGSL